MKKIIFLFAMLIISVVTNAQSGVTVAPVSAKSNTVTFNVSWLNSSRTGTHNSKVWVFVDYQTIVNNAPSGSWTRALVSGTPTATVGTPSRETGNDKGFWLQGTSGSSGTYNTTVTVQLNNVPAKFNWCAYISDCPPNVTAANGSYTFKGTPPFTLIAANGTTQIVTGTTLATSALTITPTTIRDKTECPGDFCIYTGSDLHIDATHLCQQRTSGAKNWQVYIKDNRDSKIYRVIQMPNGEWWLADYLDYIQSGITTLVYDGLRYYKSWPTCPANWTIWSVSKAKSLITTYGSTNLTRVKATSRWLTKFAGDDYYGLTLYPTHSVNINWTGATNDFDNSTISVVPSCSTAKDLGAGIYQGNAWSDCFDDDGNVAKRRDPPGVPVRCFRQL